MKDEALLALMAAIIYSGSSCQTVHEAVEKAGKIADEIAKIPSE